MKNFDLIRRFTIGSMILGLVVPMIYHINLNINSHNHFNKLTAQVCKAIEPRIQIGAHREALEYFKSAITNQSLDAEPVIEFKDHGAIVTPPILNERSKFRESCEFQGITGIEANVFYNRVPLLNIFYLYLYLCFVAFVFLLFLCTRRRIL